jgi:hypothetical protein
MLFLVPHKNKHLTKRMNKVQGNRNYNFQIPCHSLQCEYADVNVCVCVWVSGKVALGIYHNRRFHAKSTLGNVAHS